MYIKITERLWANLLPFGIIFSISEVLSKNVINFSLFHLVLGPELSATRTCMGWNRGCYMYIHIYEHIIHAHVYIYLLENLPLLIKYYYVNSMHHFQSQ